ncbi:hypothetical protein [Pseudomonas aeruginosa]|uniref:hypothetical protein n=1 Tax=Pseudomonas aeruginosa TaxID=287 RepID=UPI0039082849
MTKANECTCPSGDGSLRHPCPAHPASVELAGVGAKLTFINGRPAMCGCQVEYSSGGGEYSDVIDVTLCAKHSGSAILDLVATNRIALTPEYEGQWHADFYLDREIPLAKAEGATPAEAVLALMSAERIDPEQESVEQAGGDERAAFFKHLIGRHPAHETEIVRVVEHNYAAWKAWRARADLAQPSPAQAEQAEAERPEVVGQLVTWPTGQRYVGRVRERKSCKTEDVMTVAQHERIAASRWERAMDLMGEHVARISDKLTAERDAALAEVERLRQFERICEGLPQDAIDGCWTVQGIRGYAKSLEDQLKVALARVAELEAKLGPALGLLRESRGFVDCDNPLNESGQIKLLEEIDAFLTSPVAQAQHSVPRAWLDVQAERRRQVEVEGYHGFRDSHYISYELSKAARAYIEVSWHALSGGLPCKQPESWPWMAGFKWSDGRTMLVKACALTLAEIERLDRAAAPGKEG